MKLKKNKEVLLLKLLLLLQKINDKPKYNAEK